jgi:hypothetical protein
LVNRAIGQPYRMGTEQQQQSDSKEPQQSDSGEQQQSDSGEPQQSDSKEHQQSDSGDQERTDSGQLTEKPDVTDEHKDKAKEMAKAYSDDLQTTTLPGSDGTVSGTAVTDWVDEEDKGKIETSSEEGNVEYRKTDEFRKTMEE